MAGERLGSLDQADFTQPGPLAALARAEQARSIPGAEGVARISGPRGDAAIQPGPDLIAPASDHAPRGVAALVDTALGRVELPTLHALHEALGRAHAALTPDRPASAPVSGGTVRVSDLTPDIGMDAGPDPNLDLGALDLVLRAVLEDERAKISRYLTVRAS